MSYPDQRQTAPGNGQMAMGKAGREGENPIVEACTPCWGSAEVGWGNQQSQPAEQPGQVLSLARTPERQVAYGS